MSIKKVRKGLTKFRIVDTFREGEGHIHFLNMVPVMFYFSTWILDTK